MPLMDDPMNLQCTLPYPKTLDKNILAIRARETQEVVPENGVHENIVDVTASNHMMEATDSAVGMEVAPLDLQHNTEHNGTSKHGDGAQTEAAERVGLALPANKEDKVMDEQHEGSGGVLRCRLQLQEGMKSEGKHNRRNGRSAQRIGLLRKLMSYSCK